MISSTIQLDPAGSNWCLRVNLFQRDEAGLLCIEFAPEPDSGKDVAGLVTRNSFLVIWKVELCQLGIITVLMGRQPTKTQPGITHRVLKPTLVEPVTRTSRNRWGPPLSQVPSEAHLPTSMIELALVNPGKQCEFRKLDVSCFKIPSHFGVTDTLNMFPKIPAEGNLTIAIWIQRNTPSRCLRIHWVGPGLGLTPRRSARRRFKQAGAATEPNFRDSRRRNPCGGISYKPLASGRTRPEQFGSK